MTTIATTTKKKKKGDTKKKNSSAGSGSFKDGKVKQGLEASPLNCQLSENRRAEQRVTLRCSSTNRSVHRAAVLLHW